MNVHSFDDDGWPWVIKLKEDTNRDDVRAAIGQASREGKPIVFRVIKDEADLDTFVAEIVKHAVDRNVTITIEPTSDEQ